MITIAQNINAKTFENKTRTPIWYR